MNILFLKNIVHDITTTKIYGHPYMVQLHLSLKIYHKQCNITNKQDY